MKGYAFVAGFSAVIVIAVWVGLGLLFRYMVDSGSLDPMVFTLFNGLMIVMLFLVPGLAIYISGRNRS